MVLGKETDNLRLKTELRNSVHDLSPRFTLFNESHPASFAIVVNEPSPSLVTSLREGVAGRRAAKGGGLVSAALASSFLGNSD